MFINKFKNIMFCLNTYTVDTLGNSNNLLVFKLK